MTGRLKPNTDAMFDGLSFWFKHCYRGALEIGWRDPESKKLNKFKRFDLTEIEELVAFAADINQQPGANMYFRVSTLKDMPGPTTDEHFWMAPGAHVDHDDAESVARLQSHPLQMKPAFLIITGRSPAIRAQSFWPISEPTINPQMVRQFNGNLAHHFGGDPAVVNPTRLMRMPGSIAWPVKPGRTEPELTELLWPKDGRPGRYPLHAMIDYTKSIGPATTPTLPEQPLTTAPAAPAVAQDGWAVDLGSTPSSGSISALIDQIRQPHQWHNAMLRLVASWVNRGISDAEIMLAAPGVTMSGYTVSQTRKDLEGMISSAREKWQLPNVDPIAGEAEAKRKSELTPLPLIYFPDIQPNLDTADFIEGVVVEGAMSVTYGESNCGKTFFMTDMGLHVAAGMPWRNRAVEKGGVIYCALEGSHGISNRVAAFRKHYALEGVNLPFAIIPVAMNLLDPEADTQRLIEAIQTAAKAMDIPVKLVILDTLSRALAGGNENAPDDMGALVSNIDRVRQATGAHVNVVHHSGKDAAKGARGHSLLRAATDTEIEISRPDPKAPSLAVVKKQRDLEIEGSWGFSLHTVELGMNRRGKPVTSCVALPEDPPEAEKSKGIRLNDWETIAMRALHDCIGERGEVGFGNLPRVKNVSVETWRAKWVSRASIDDPVTKRVTWARVKQRLIKLQLVGFMDEKVWIIQDVMQIDV